MAAWFETEARVTEPPELLERTIAQRRSTRPRPAWLLRERWLPMQLTMERVRFPRAAAYAALLLVLILVSVIGLLVVGSRHPVPPPFGLAANGQVAIVTPTGDIATVDPVTGASTTIVGGPESGSLPGVLPRRHADRVHPDARAPATRVFAVDRTGAT